MADGPANPEFTRAEELFNEGTRRMSAGKGGEAEACFREAIRLEPEFARAHTNLALLLETDGRLAEAERHYRRAISADPGRGNAHLNLGVLLAGQRRFPEAEACYLRAAELMPDAAAVWSNLGVLQSCQKREREAESSYRQAMRVDPDYRLAYFNLSYLLLRQGRFEEGWFCLEKRDWYLELEKHVHCPRWRGEPLEGRSLLIGFEAGHGDMIQMCRYAAVLKKRGAARISMICHPALKTLLATLPALDEVFAYDEIFSSSRWDFWTPPFSIAYHCGTRLDSIPDEIPYLRADAALVESWSELLAAACAGTEFRVGLVWKGSVGFENDADRSLPDLRTLESLGTVPGVRYFSLQKGAGEEDAANPPAGLPLADLGPRIRDFADTAAIVTNLHLVICVDTAVAHLAGALGKRCWLLLPDYKTDWRWLTERDDSPWYPGVMRLFRQSPRGEWGEVVDRVRLELERLVHELGGVR